MMQYTLNGEDLANKITTINIGKSIFMIEYNCPPSVKNETENAYSTVLKSIKITS